MLVQRRRRWANIKPMVAQRHAFAAVGLYIVLLHCQLALDTCLGILRLMTSGQLLQPRKHEPLPNIGLMLAHRLRRWPLIKPKLAECVVSTGNYCAPE